MTIEQQTVSKWMTDFRQEVKSKPTIPSLEVRMLRAKLILEEALETIEALGFNIIVEEPYVGYVAGCNVEVTHSTKFTMVERYTPKLKEIADGLGDLHVVGYCGTGAACGLDMEPLTKEIFRSNDSKYWTVEEWNSLPPTFNVYGITKTLLPSGKMIVYRNGKIVKPPCYSPPNLGPIIEEQIRVGEIIENGK